MRRDQKQDKLAQMVEEVLKTSHPRTVRDLVGNVQSREPSVSESSILQTVENLRQSDRLITAPPRFESFQKFFINHRWNIELWPIMIVLLLASLLVVPLAFPWSLLKLSSVILVFYLPGRGLLRILLREREPAPMERLLLEVASSMVLIMMLGLALSLSGLGIFSGTAAASVVALNLLVSVAASYREYGDLRDQSNA